MMHGLARPSTIALAVLAATMAAGHLAAVIQPAAIEDRATGPRLGPFGPEAIESAVGAEVHRGAIVLARRAGAYARSGVALLKPLGMGRAFDTLQVGLDARLAAGTGIEVWMRALDTASGRASRWYWVRRESEVLLDGPADAVQFRILLASRAPRSTPRLRAIMIDGTNRRPIGPVAPGTFAQVPSPPVVQRAAWGARAPKEPYDPLVPETITVHHTYQPSHAGYRGATTVRGIQRFHQDDRGWNDIGYHYLIGPDGLVYKGRPEDALGAHSPPNSGKLGICVIGNFEEDRDQPTAEQRARLVELLAHLAGRHGIATGSILGHRDHNSTGCPGEVLYRMLPALREEVGRVVGAALR